MSLRSFISQAALGAVLWVAAAHGASAELVCRDPGSGEMRAGIAGGQDATAKEYPFILRLDTGDSTCGGALIAPGFAVTAAHCVIADPATGCAAESPGRCAVKPANHMVVTRPGPSGRADGAARSVKHVFAHPDFRYPSDDFTHGALDADVALLVLDQPYAVTKAEVARMAAPAFDRSYAQGGECARVAGWGATHVLDSWNRPIRIGQRATERLQSLGLALATQDACRSKYGGYITDAMLCAGDGVEGFNTCRGDSGGPLVVDVGVPVLVGLVSWSFGCAQQEHYTIFTRVGSPKVRDWIFKTLRGEP